MTEDLSKSSLSHWGPRLPYLLFIMMVLCFAANPFSLLDFPLDDAWIHRVYSQSFAFGHGFAYNPGQQEAGSTSPLWSIITAPAHWLQPLGTDAITLAVKLAGIALALFCVHAVRQIGESFSKSTTVGLIAATVLALDPRLTFSALSGMETTLLLALWLGSTISLMRGRLFLSATLMSLAPTARPEALVILPIFALAVLLTTPRKWWVLFILPLPMFLWGLFCNMANGHWLPTTFYMKSTTLKVGLQQFIDAWTLLGKHGPLPSLVVAGLLLCTMLFLLRRNKNIPTLFLLLISPLAFLFGVLFTREFEMSGFYWLRWTDPAILILNATGALALGLLLSASNGWKSRTTIALALLVTLPHFIGSFTSWRSRLITDSRSINLITIQAGKWINENTPENAVIAVNDAGATRYFGKRRTIDLMGLNCADIAFSHAPDKDRGIVDYLAITPTWFYGKGVYDGLPVVTNFSIPPAEYTITSNKGQSEIVIFRCR